MFRVKVSDILLGHYTFFLNMEATRYSEMSDLHTGPRYVENQNTTI